MISEQTPVARTGRMTYRASEIGAPGDGLISVVRTAAEVFRPETVRSFNGKSLTLDHPVQFLDSSTTGAFHVGTCMNVRPGPRLETGEQSLIADIVITEANAIARVQAGLRELSAGYQCKYRQNADGDWEQYEIIGNHIALVSSGRAGEHVKIRDSAAYEACELEDLAIAVKDGNTIRIVPEIRVEAPAPQPKGERKTMPAKSGTVLARMLAVFAKDSATDPEELESAIDAVTDKKAKDLAEIAAERAAKEAGDKKATDAEKEKEAAMKEKEKEETDRKAKDAADKAAADAKAIADKKAKDDDEKEKKEASDKAVADRAAKDAAEKEAGMQLHPDLKEACDSIRSMKDSLEDMKSHLGVEAKDRSVKDEDLIPVTVEPEADRTKNPIPGADASPFKSAIDALRATKDSVVASKDPVKIAAYNTAMDSLKGLSTGTTNGYGGIVTAGRPDRTAAVPHMTDSIDKLAGAGGSVLSPAESARLANEGIEAMAKKLRTNGGVQ